MLITFEFIVLFVIRRASHVQNTFAVQQDLIRSILILGIDV